MLGENRLHRCYTAEQVSEEVAFMAEILDEIHPLESGVMAICRIPQIWGKLVPLHFTIQELVAAGGQLSLSPETSKEWTKMTQKVHHKRLLRRRALRQAQDAEFGRYPDTEPTPTVCNEKCSSCSQRCSAAFTHEHHSCRQCFEVKNEKVTCQECERPLQDYSGAAKHHDKCPNCHAHVREAGVQEKPRRPEDEPNCPMLQSVPDPPQSRRHEAAAGLPVQLQPGGLSGSSQDGALNYAIHTPRQVKNQHEVQQMLDDEALAKRLAEEADPDEAHQAEKDRKDLLDEEARLQKRLQEIQLKKQMPHACKAITGQIEHQQAEKGFQGHPGQAPLQTSTGNTSPGEVLPRGAAAPAIAGTPTPPEDTPSEGGAPREAHVQADAPTASLMSLAVRAHATEAYDCSSGVSQPTGEADADDIASIAMSDITSIAMSEHVLPTVV